MTPAERAEWLEKARGLRSLCGKLNSRMSCFQREFHLNKCRMFVSNGPLGKNILQDTHEEVHWCHFEGRTARCWQ